jgi:hypothetical protein
MVLPLSGQISLLSLQDEFGGSNPIGIDEYYSSGGAPGSGQIGINTFYGRFANWTTYMMGYYDLSGSISNNSYSGNIVVPGSSRSPTVFTINFNRTTIDFTGTLSIYVNEVLNSTYTNGAVGNINVANPSISFGSSSIRFSSTITDVSDIFAPQSEWKVSVGSTLVYYHSYEDNS